jgi:hypothetical protein
VQRYALNQLRLRRLSLCVVAYNLRAIRAYEKCGFRIEGREREAALVDGQWHDDVMMGMLDREYASTRGIDDRVTCWSGRKRPARLRSTPDSGRRRCPAANSPIRAIGGHDFWEEAVGRTLRLRMRSEAFSAIITTTALMFPPTRSGITDASTTRRPVVPATRSS